MALTDQDKYILLAVLAVLMVFVLYFEVRVMRGKAKEVRRKSQKKDEVYNSIITTRSVMNVMERQGKDVSVARGHLDMAKDAMSRGEYESSVRYCEKAKDELTKVRATTPPPVQRESGYDEGAGDSLEKVAESILSSPSAISPTTTDGYKGTRLQDDKGVNYMSAKFEINRAKGEVSKAASDGYDVFKAERLIQEAESCFAAGDYTRSLSLALKARKLSGPEEASETIPLRTTEEKELPPPEVEEVEEIETAAGTCGKCGATFHGDDSFCPRCGKKVSRERKCPDCGALPRESDSFCRKCGARIP